RRLGPRLRALIAAAPLIGLPVCSGRPPFGPCDPPPENETFWLTRDDAGALSFPFPPGIVVPALPDGGLDCETPCNQLPGNYALLQASSRDIGPLESCAVESDGGDGLPVVTCVFEEFQCVGGRRPTSLLSSRSPRSSELLGSYWAEAARLEAASVPAFRILED